MVNRKSTNAYNIFGCGCLVADGSKQQSVQDQSSGEAEAYAAASGVSVGILVDVVLDWCEYKQPNIELRLDSKAAKSITLRLGVGVVRHLAARILWIQQMARQKLMRVAKVSGEEDHSHIGTKVLTADQFRALSRMMKLRDVNDVEGLPEARCHNISAEEMAEGANLLRVGKAIARRIGVE